MNEAVSNRQVIARLRIKDRIMCEREQPCLNLIYHGHVSLEVLRKNTKNLTITCNAAQIRITHFRLEFAVEPTCFASSKRFGYISLRC
jgi:hypothetical protein